MKEVIKKKKNDIINFVKNNHKKCIILVSIVVLAIMLILGIVFFAKNHSVSSRKNQYEKILKEVGIDFYENYYYDRTGKNDEERKNFLIKYQTGIKINLDNLSRYNKGVNKEKLEKLTDSDSKNVCDSKKTQVIIIPKEEYKKSDYEIKVELHCGFDDEEK